MKLSSQTVVENDYGAGIDEQLNGNDISTSGTHFEFCNQIALADVILLNKVDLVDEAVLQDTLRTVKSINASSKIHKTSYGKIDLEQILDLHAYDTGRLKDFNDAIPDTVKNDEVVLSHSSKQQSSVKNTGASGNHFTNGNHTNSNRHLDRTISTCTFHFEGTMDENDLDRVLEDLLWSNHDPSSGTSNKTTVLRLKAVVNLTKNPETSYQVQAVYDIFDKYRLPDILEPNNKVIVIGHNLNREDIENKFKTIANL